MKFVRVGRNRPCPCLSGKKFNHCCLTKKPAGTALTLDLGAPRPVDMWALGPDGQVKLYYQGQEVVPVAARLERMYEREKTPKILNYAPVPVNSLTVSDPGFLGHYDVVLGVDTNTRRIANDFVSISAACRCWIEPLTGLVYLAKFGILGWFEMRNVATKPENVAWRLLIEGVQRSPEFRPGLRFALVVDSDLGNIPSYNSRALPIDKEFDLPPDFTLIYASADRRSDQAGNLLIGLCDREAKLLLDHLVAVPQSPERHALQAVQGRPYTHFRQWVPNR